tara:strand:- start:1520 stop:1720 length:201 start_codon:yes stop_codon:yes gene_type:complete
MTKKIMMNELWPYEKIFPIEKCTERKIEPIENLNNCHNNSNKDNYSCNNKRKNYYGKKRYNYSDYC